jgi:uncharacterized phage infection (PIP) family protein YhgE
VRHTKKLITELDQIKQENENLRDSCRERQQTVDTLKSKMKKLRRRNENNQAELDLAQPRFAALHDENSTVSNELRAVRGELQHKEDQLGQTSRLLLETTTELNATQKFLPRADVLPGAEVVELVQSLNNEILQLAAGIAESWEFLSPCSASWHRLMEEDLNWEAFESARNDIGEILQHVLTRGLIPAPGSDERDLLILIQIALQTCMVRCCGDIMMCWTWREPIDQMLWRLHGRLLDTGEHFKHVVM